MMDDERKEQIRAKIQSHVRAEEAAYRCVERLAVVECITKEEFRHILSIITLSHYQDITEERFVSKMCGYALCSNKISKVVKQKFHISTNSNKVYDMEERKRFCSLHCFKASKHLERQMQESPFCTTSTEKKITFIDEVVDSTPFVLDCEIKMMEMLKLTDDDKSYTEEQYIGDAGSSKNKDFKSVYQKDSNPPTNLMKNTNQSTQKTKLKEKQAILIIPEIEKNVLPSKTGLKPDDLNTLVELVEILKSWFTPKSLDYLFNTENINKNNLKKSVIKFDFTNMDNDNIEKKVDVGIMQNFNQKAMGFLTRQPEWVSETVVSNKHLITKDDSENISTPPLIVDSKSQSVIRKRIVKEKLTSSLKNLLTVVGMTITDLSELGFFSLVDTFRFTSKNIVLKPKQWHNIGLILLKLLSKNNHDLASSFDSRSFEVDELAKREGLITMDNLNFVVESIKNMKIT
ncbi:putative RNA polymerase II subunit B1 CTD phosphatase RPAP2 isoform X1 [Hydra vulgaris]|uniref:putative RNA polymerase II subunit B1 CTD phosphatase RPAP2 isoform X1 n=2 Tax=Hydra vulgaris TaxID=6087 RepID=UPI001F5F75E8|nr:putative RNA polymerase II subunit B1 CTD phosphatase RPAP2 isoform X1 [Hydra vulgaris]